MYTEIINKFAAYMKRELENNSKKGGWEYLPDSYLLKRLHEEIRELEALTVDDSTASYEEVMTEASDIANFALMIADNYGRRIDGI